MLPYIKWRLSLKLFITILIDFVEDIFPEFLFSSCLGLVHINV